MVFCEDCKYLYRDLWGDGIYHCSKEKTIENTFLRSYIKHPLAEETNKNNDCKDYEERDCEKKEIKTDDSKHKWWKFWVK